MKYTDVLHTIVDLGDNKSLDFLSRSSRIEHLLDQVSESDILEHLDYAGVIPEAFGHDSTEEKLFAKYCDALLAKSLSLIGMNTSVITERGDSADVVAEFDDYRVVGDAKAFRLSRTAKNQKDFKVEALNSWRKGADYAMLCSPLYQYPARTSQIYAQASTYNVTLLSYTHLAFIIRNKPTNLDSLRSLWEVSKSISTSKDSVTYWEAVAKTVSSICGTTLNAWATAKGEMRRRLPLQAREQITYWEDEMDRIRQLSHDQTVQRLITALKIESKIDTIKKNTSE